MARPLRRKHQKSSLPRTTQPSSRRKPPTKRLPLTNPLIASKWDKKLTLAQNYRKLGLSSKLNVRSGGVEKVRKVKDGEEGRKEVVMEEERDPLAFASGDGIFGKRKRGESAAAGVGVTKVVRDEEGKITRVVHETHENGEGRRRKSNPLNDPLVDLESDSDTAEDLNSSRQRGHIPQHSLPPAPNNRNTKPSVSPTDNNTTNVVPALEALASATKKPKPRQQSQFEKEWIERLVAKHGDDIAAMSRDRKLNPRQQTEGDIGRRVKIWREGKGEG